MAFDMDAFTGALWSLSEAMDEAAKKTGIEREQLSLALHRHAIACKKKREAELWKHASSEQALNKWIYKKAGGNFDTANERESLRLAHEIPALVQRNLIEIAKTLGVLKGGKPPALDLFERWEAKRRVSVLTVKRHLSKEKAYGNVAKQLKVSAHTIRRVCEPRERDRSRYHKEVKFDLSQSAMQ